MSIICQDAVGRCSFIDVLEEAVLMHRPVAVLLRDGERFIDVVVDVVTENHEDYAVFRAHDRVAGDRDRRGHPRRSASRALKRGVCAP